MFIFYRGSRFFVISKSVKCVKKECVYSNRNYHFLIFKFCKDTVWENLFLFKKGYQGIAYAGVYSRSEIPDPENCMLDTERARDEVGKSKL